MCCAQNLMLVLFLGRIYLIMLRVCVLSALIVYFCRAARERAARAVAAEARAKELSRRTKLCGEMRASAALFADLHRRAWATELAMGHAFANFVLGRAQTATALPGRGEAAAQGNTGQWSAAQSCVCPVSQPPLLSPWCAMGVCGHTECTLPSSSVDPLLLSRLSLLAPLDPNPLPTHTVVSVLSGRPSSPSPPSLLSPVTHMVWPGQAVTSAGEALAALARQETEERERIVACVEMAKHDDRTMCVVSCFSYSVVALQ